VPRPAGRLTQAQLVRLRDEFIVRYRRRYYRLNPDVPVEIVRWRVSVSGPKPELRIAPVASAQRTARKGVRPVYFAEADGYVECAVYDRFVLTAGKHFRGPAVVEEPESTVVIGPSASAVSDRDGNLMVTLSGARREKAAA
jgi:N-methylhydantoinase A/oxoprolinase/acetone carboxylase beta subunit